MESQISKGGKGKTTFRVLDADTHIGPTMQNLEPYLSNDSKNRLAPFSQWRGTDKKGNIVYSMGRRTFTRPLGTVAEAAKQDTGYVSQPDTGNIREVDPDFEGENDPTKRIADMDREGVEVNFMLPSPPFGAFTVIDDLVLEQAMYTAYHSWMRDYCAAYPKRLTGVMVFSGRDVKASLEQFEKFASDPWALGVLCWAPDSMPLDHPDLEPLWAAASDWNLTVVLHSAHAMPPYAPGGLETWGNVFLQRAVAQPWAAMRDMACLLGAGVFDRHPKLRLAVLEAGHGWLPSWIFRLDEIAKTTRGALPALKMLPSEYAKSGQYFQSIEMAEGKEVTQAAIDLLGDSVLMYASDYPHGECWFPNSVKTVDNWQLKPDIAQKLFWDNAMRCYERYSDQL